MVIKLRSKFVKFYYHLKMKGILEKLKLKNKNILMNFVK
jgi:hypothetical protein